LLTISGNLPTWVSFTSRHAVIITETTVGGCVDLNRLRECRQALGLAQQALAVQAGVSISTITMIEVHGYRPTESVRERIAAVLEVRAEELWPRERTSARLGQKQVPA
jgi:DNA-binding XRE family transcriptional regulator